MFHCKKINHLLSEGHDDVAQVGEAVVDGLGLLQPHPRGAAALLDPLASGQVHLGEGGVIIG